MTIPVEKSSPPLSRLALWAVMGFIVAAALLGGSLLIYEWLEGRHGTATGGNLTVKGDIWDADPKQPSGAMTLPKPGATLPAMPGTAPSQPKFAGATPTPPRLATPPAPTAKAEPKGELLHPPKEDPVK
jgi:hypothetical protein